MYETQQLQYQEGIFRGRNACILQKEWSQIKSLILPLKYLVEERKNQIQVDRRKKAIKTKAGISKIENRKQEGKINST